MPTATAATHRGAGMDEAVEARVAWPAVPLRLARDGSGVPGPGGAADVALLGPDP